MSIITDMAAKLGRGAWGLSGFSHPLSAGVQGLTMSYPLTKDAANPGAAESRASRGSAMRDAYRAQFNEDRGRQGVPPMQAPKPMYPMVDAMADHNSTTGLPPMQEQRPRVMITGGEQMPQVPLPQARPQEAPQASQNPDISWFLRNAYNQTDQNGAQIDPALASKYEARNPFAGLFTS